MDSNLLWTALLALAVLCAGLIVYSFWPWTRHGDRQMARRALLIGAAVLVAGVPAAMKLSLTIPGRADALAEQDDAALAAFVAKRGQLGTPAKTAEASPDKTPHPDMSLESVTAGLEKKLESAPDDVNGWILLGRSYVALRNWDRAKKIFQQTMQKWPDNTDVKVAYAESLMAAADGRVTDQARQAFEAALSTDQSNIRARFNLALYDFQAGKAEEAQKAWVKLASELPDDSPWRPEIQKGLDEASAKLGAPAPMVVTAATASPATAPSVPAARGPSQADIAAAGAMSPQERTAFIESMVDGLKAKLEANPNDRDGWVRLGRSYGVLGRWGEARDAYEAGLKHFPNDADLAAGLATSRSKT